MNVYEQLDLIGQLEEQGQVNDAYKKYNELIKELKKDDANNMLGQVYAGFAEFLFANQAYEQSVDMFVNAYKKNYMQDGIKQILYSAFIDCNQEFFKSCYEKNLTALSNGKELLTQYKYEDLSLDFVGTDNIYQVFDKGTNGFIEKIKIEQADKNKTFKTKDAFSDFALYIDYKLFSILSLVHYVKAQNRKLYIVVKDIKEFLSCLKTADFSSELKDIYVFSSVQQFKEFFVGNVDIYLPRNVLSASDDYVDKLNICLDEVHQQRLLMPKKEGNILLTIGIPSYNRGHRALQAVQHLVNCTYDSEVEFLVSNNDSNENTKGYEQIKSMAQEDSRISYYDVDPNIEKQGFFRNFKYIFNKAKGKYCLFLSDEDFVFLDKLPVYLAMMRDNDNVAIIAASGTGELSCKNKDGYYAKGATAQNEFFLSNNYISGAIYNKQIFDQIKAQVWLDSKNTGDNIAFNLYPHMFLDMFMLGYGDLICCKEHLIYFDDITSEQTSLKSSDKVQGLSEYAVYDSRLLQHNSWYELVLEIAKDDRGLLLDLNNFLMGKTIALIYLVKNQQIDAGLDWEFIINETTDVLIKSFELYCKDVCIAEKGDGLAGFEQEKEFRKATIANYLNTGKFLQK